jgi:hypothetical protein
MRDTAVGPLELAPGAQLLVCPTVEAASARAVIGPDGGSVGARGSSIPAGAVPEPTPFEVVVPVSPFMEVAGSTRSAGRATRSSEFPDPASDIARRRCAVPARFPEAVRKLQVAGVE